MLKAGDSDPLSRVGDSLYSDLTGFLIHLDCTAKLGATVDHESRRDSKESKIWSRRKSVLFCYSSPDGLIQVGVTDLVLKHLPRWYFRKRNEDLT